MTRYEDMKELTLADWDGTPLECYYTDEPQAYSDVDDVGKPVIGYVDGSWILGGSIYHWKHVYPVEWNKPQPKPRMTFHQLAIWLSRGCDRLVVTSTGIVSTNISFNITRLEEEVPEDFRIGWDDDGLIVWHEPTVDLLKG